MKELTLRQQQEIELDIMKEIHRICTENNIKYGLMYGSLLGAIRHKGFIPWDDDIDIYMLREDYEKFIKLCETGSLKKGYLIQNWHTDENFEFIISRICKEGTYSDTPSRKKMKTWSYCYVDVFPFDFVPKGNKRQLHKRMLQINNFVTRCRVNYKYEENGTLKKGIKNLVSKATSFIPIQKFVRNHEKISNKYPRSELVVGTGGGYEYDREVQLLSDLENVELIDFEDTKFYAPKEYDRILKNLYGDYMKLPPEDERICKHKAYILEKGE